MSDMTREERIQQMANEQKALWRRWVRRGFAGVMLLVVLLAGSMYGCPQYEVYRQGKRGEAELKRAEYNRRSKVYEAEARLESAKLDAQAEVERAKGVSQANEIIADGLKGHSEYLNYLWITGVSGAEGRGREIIYVPTEANIPILEAGRLREAPAP
jgi:hypothetical protein